MLAVISLAVRGGMLLSYIGFTLIRPVILTMRRRMLVFRERLSLGNMMGLGMGRRLMCVRRMLIPIRGNFFYRSGIPILVMSVMLVLMLILLMVFIFRIALLFIVMRIVVTVVNNASLKNETRQKYAQYERNRIY